jgi:neutral/alkaline ceramidase-like enzyme
MSCRALVAVFFLAPGLVAAAPSQGASDLMAGAARIDITPPQSALSPGDSIRDHLYVRAIVMKNKSGGCGVLVGMDQGGARNDMIQDSLPRAAKAANCPQQNFVISATHTHSGATGGLSGGLPTNKDVAEAVVKAVIEANAKLAPARIGFGTTDVHLNVNRDAFQNNWMQGVNREAPSDKTLAVVAVIGADNLPIGFYMNYAMHPIDFYLTGVLSGDFAGEASRYVERRYDGKTVAIFAQGASGDQNPLLVAPMQKLAGLRTRMEGRGDEHYGALSPWENSARRLNGNADATTQYKIPLKPEEIAAYKAAIDTDDRMVTAMGTIIGESALDVMKNRMPNVSGTVAIAAGERQITCPGRDRVDESARQGVLPPYKDGAPVNLVVGLLRIGDIDIVRVNGEVYNDIWRDLRDRMPNRKTMMTTLANGAANSGYIYSDAANTRLTFQVISSRLKPGCAQAGITGAALDMAADAGK